MNLKEILNWRYTTKEFDTSKKISETDMTEVKNLLRMSPSSVVNLLNRIYEYL